RCFASPGERCPIPRQSVDYAICAAGGGPPSLLDYPREAASRVRSHISPGPYRSFRELSLAGSVDPDIWCPPTFVGNSGIECFNGVRGFALRSAVSVQALSLWNTGSSAPERSCASGG